MKSVLAKFQPFKMVLALAAALSLSLPAQALVAGGGGGGGGAPAPAPSAEDGRRRSITSSEDYLPLPELMTTVQADFRSAGLMQVEAGLEISDRQLLRRAQENMPRLRDAYVSALSLYAGINYRFGDVPDVDRIIELMQNATDHALGQEGAVVYISMVMIHAN